MPFSAKDTDYKKLIELMAESLLHGDRGNMVFYLHTFAEIAGQRIRTLERLQAMLRDVIYSNARLKVSLFVSNSGREIAIMKPVFGFLIDHTDFKKPFVLTTTTTATKSSTTRYTVIAPVLPESSPTPAFSIEPGKSNTLRLVGLEPLGPKAQQISEIYTSGLLRCKVVAFSNSGATVESPTSVFGSRINPEDLKRVDSLVQ
jgi:hypothetical protein